MQPRAVTFVIFDGFDALDLAGPFEVFGEAGYELTGRGPEGGPGPIGHGADDPRAKLGGEPGPGAVPERCWSWGVTALTRRGPTAAWSTGAAARKLALTKADRVACVCCGAFLLAEAGGCSTGAA